MGNTTRFKAFRSRDLVPRDGIAEEVNLSFADSFSDSWVNSLERDSPIPPRRGTVRDNRAIAILADRQVYVLQPSLASFVSLWSFTVRDSDFTAKVPEELS